MIVTLTNLLNPNEFTFNGASMTDGVINYTANVFGMVMQTMPDAIANHIYYGRCYQKTEPGYTQADGRFEMMKDDNYQNCFTFGTFFDTNGEWVRISDCVSRDAPEAEAYNLRSFTVNPTTNAYRKELIIIDLTAAFGAGNEPTKDWCDANIPYFVGQKKIIVGGGIVPIKYALRRRMMGKASSAISFSYDGEYTLDGNVLRLLSSGVLTLSRDTVCDIFLVGGGGGGALRRQYTAAGSSNTYYYGGGGGGGGYTITALSIQLTAGNHRVSIGEGGAASTAGGTTSLDNYSALGGNPGNRASASTSSREQKGGDGGSGGGGGGTCRKGNSGNTISTPGTGGKDGNGGGKATSGTVNGGDGGNGQGTTTRAFGEANGELFATGGDGGTGTGNPSPSQKTANTGDGGDGGRGTASAAPTAGASGIVLIRFAADTELKAV